MPSKRSASASPNASIKRGSLRRGELQDQVLARLRRGLMVGALVPGQVMSLRKLASNLGTSPMPIRGALTQLVAAGALEELPNRSVRVPWLSEGRIAELFQIREVIEGMAAKEACNKATPELIDRLEKINRELIHAIGKRDLLSCLSSNQKFHFSLYQAARMEVLMPLIEALWLQCGPTMYFSLLSPSMPWDASAHTEILSGLRAGKPSLVQRALTQDIRTTARNLLNGTSDHHIFNGSLVAPQIDTYF